MRPEDLDDYDDIARKFAESIPAEYRLAGLAPEQRLAGLAPEQRLAGLSTEEQWLALSDEALRALPSAFIDALSAPVRKRIRERIGG